MKVIDIIFVGFLLLIVLFMCGAVMGLFVAIENQNIRQEFCENEGFEGQEMGRKYHEGYCYKMQEGNAIKKDFFCKPTPNPLTVIGKCNFLEVK